MYFPSPRPCSASTLIPTTTFPRRLGIRFFSWLIGVLGGTTVSDPTSGLRCAGPRVWNRFARHYPEDYPEPESLFWCVRNRLKIDSAVGNAFTPPSAASLPAGTGSLGCEGMKDDMTVKLLVVQGRPFGKSLLFPCGDCFLLVDHIAILGVNVVANRRKLQVERFEGALPALL